MRLIMSVRSEFSCDSKSVLKRGPARVSWGAEYGGADLKYAKSLAFSGPPPPSSIFLVVMDVTLLSGTLYRSLNTVRI